MSSPRIDASSFLLAVIAVLLAGGILIALWVLRADPIEEAVSGDRVINTLFVIENRGKPFCSYVLMYYPTTKRAAVFDVPGSVGLILKRINQVDRIDTVYTPQGIGPFENEIEGLLGIDISYYLVFDIENLGRIVDLIAGVELFIPSPVEIYQGDKTILFPSGLTRLDGDKARLYIAYELPEENSELANFRRQRFFLGFIKRLGEMNETLKHPQTIQVYQSLFRSGMSQHVRQRLFDEFAGIDTDRLSIQSVGGNVRQVSGQTLILPYYDGNLIKDIARQTLAALTRPMEGSLGERVFTVEILNGTPVNGLGRRTAELIRGFGYDVISVGNADHSAYESTVIIDHSGYKDVVKAFADIIRCRNIRYEKTGPEDSELDLNIHNLEYRSDFTLIIGKDFNERYVTGG